jgi:hypothetical protein
MDRLEYVNLRALADERSHDLSRKDNQANGDACLKEMPQGRAAAGLPFNEVKSASDE